MPETKSRDFVFLRHGQSAGNVEGRFQGQSDFPLTSVGREQARDLGARWLAMGVMIDLILSSPLVRARETSEIIAGLLKSPVQSDPIWMERNAGEVTGLTRAEALARFPEQQFRTPYDAFGKSGEGDWGLFQRASAAVRGLLERPPGAYLVVSHGGLLDKTMYAILGIPVQDNFNGPSFRFENAGYAAFTYLGAREQWRMLQLVPPTQVV